jgi:uncharacterized protein YecE (DUF72 family)
MIRVGPAGWSYPDWDGIVYPRPKPRAFHPLPLLARLFDCVEINSSFYSMPRAEHSRNWADLVRDRADFRFTAKLHRTFTHDAELASPAFEAARDTFLAGLEPLVESRGLAALLLQFPVSFAASPQAVRKLARLLEAFSELPLAVELRHRSWFDAERVQWLRKRDVALLHIDLPAARDHPPADFPPTGKLGYYRLHGRNAENWFRREAGRDQRYDYLYPPSELEQIIARARSLAKEHDEVYVVTNNHFEGQAVVNGLELRAALGSARVAAPAQLVARYPRLAPIASILGQQQLF